VPDDRKAEATALFIRINQAHELLSDPEKRYEYDYLLEMAGGVIPPFDEAFRQIKDVHKHEIYEAYDELHPHVPTAPPEFTDSPAPVPTPAVAELAAPVEVELPDSVREALGLPPRLDPTTGGGSTDNRPA
jgi:curved DNA-binding protein CbpA